MTSIQQNIEQITSQIEGAQQKCGRGRDTVQLLAVSKTKPVEAILEAAQAGQVSFGENYVQEGANKVEYFAEHHPQLELEWHFIGPIQSNKSRHVAENFAWFIPLIEPRLLSVSTSNDLMIWHQYKC